MTFRTDHLLLERVITISQTDKLIWQSPCKQGDCVHEGGMKEDRDAAGESEEEPGQVQDVSQKEKVEEKASKEQSPNREIIVRAVDHPRFSSWIVTSGSAATNAIFDAFSSRFSLALEEIDAEPMPPGQSFSASTEVLTEALDGDVHVAVPRDLLPLYEEFLKNESSEAAEKEKVDDKNEEEPRVFHGTFEEVDRTASAIFQDKEQAAAEAKKISDDLKAAAMGADSSGSSAEDPSGSAGVFNDEGDEWPRDLNESHKRGSSGASGRHAGAGSDSDSPYKSQFDLSALKRPGESDQADSSFDKSQMFRRKGSFVSTLMKIVAVTMVFVVIGVVGMFALGGSQTTVTDGGNIPQNDLGLPVLTGNWKLKLWVETESGNIGYGETTASVVQKGQLITASGKDGNGNFTITGNIGQDGQVGIAFWKQYDVKDGRQHPFPTSFEGVVGPERGSDVVAQGSFANRLMQDMPELGKHKFEKITGYWSLSLVEESMVSKIKKMVGI